MDSFTLKLILTLTPSILCLILLIYIFAQPRKNAVVYSLLFFQLTTFIWTLGNLLEVLSQNSIMKWWAIQLSSLPLNFSGVVWLYFCSTYTNRKLFTNKFRAILLTLPSIIGEVLCLTNRYHNLFFKNEELLTAGIGGLILSLILGFYSILGMSYLFQYAANQKNISKKRSTYLLILTDLIPLMIEIIYIIDVTFVSHTLRLRFFPCFSLSVTSIFIVLIIFKYRFFDLLPLAQKDIINNLSEAIIVVDSEGKVMHYNNSFQKNFPIYKKNQSNIDINLFIRYLEQEIQDTQYSSIFDALKSQDEYSAELRFKNDQYFLITIKPIFAYKTELVGRIFSLTEITEYKRLKEAEFDVIKERNRIAQDVHDTLGHKMTLLLSLLDLININHEKNPVIVKDKIQQAIQIAEEGYAELRKSIYGLTFKELEINHLLKTLQKLFVEFTSSGMNIDFSVDGKSEYYDQSYSHIIYRICQEALTNSLKHGKAQKVSIILQFIDRKIKLYVFDNGKGCSKIKMGVGLQSMNQRVKDLNGSFIVGANDEGFNINIELPIQITKESVK